MEQDYCSNINMSKLVKFLSLTTSPKKAVILAKEVFQDGVSKELITALEMKPKKRAS